MRDALIVVDVQKDFVHPDGSLYVNSDPTTAINRLIKDRRYDHVVFTKDWHPKDTSHFDKWPEHCVAGSWGAEHPDHLVVPDNSPTILKGTLPDEDGYSGFYSAKGNIVRPTRLHELLSEHDTTHLDIVGVAYDVCVAATAIDAANLGYQTTVLKTYTASVNPDDEVETTKRLTEANVFVDAWSKHA